MSKNVKKILIGPVMTTLWFPVGAGFPNPDELG